MRIAGKALRYTLEMAVVEGHTLPGPVLKAFKRMQACLGLWHDYVVLTEAALRASLEPLAAGQPPPLFGGLEPYPDNWRAVARRPDVLPHFPMVLHRGGYPDGS